MATAVGSGQIAFGLTDTDDAMGEVDAGSPVEIVYPDRSPDALGTLFIPNTLAIIKGSPHQKEALALADYLLNPKIEEALATGPSARFLSLRSTKVQARVETPRTVHAMESISKPQSSSGTGSLHSWSPNSRMTERTGPARLACRDL